jgi:hypothetical protein
MIGSTMMRVPVAGLFAGMAAMAATTASTPVTFNQDILPILQKECQGCHRPGEVAPMSFLTYQDTRPWAKAIKTAVLTKKMPPWFADPGYGHFSNERKLTDAKIGTLVRWADDGAPEGSANQRPAPVEFVEGWNIGKPDKVLDMPQPFAVPAQGTIEYQYILIPGGFTQDTWVTAAEVRPGNRAVLHHVIAFVRPPGSKWMKEAKPGVPFVPVVHKRDANGAGVGVERQTADPQKRTERSGDGEGGGIASSEFLTGYAPGLQPQRFDLGHGAKLIPAGSDIVLQMHYTANGKAATDLTKIGLVLAKQPPQRRYLTMNATQARFAIPPGDPNYEVKSQVTLQDTSELVWLMPHMHLRGKDFEFRAVYPTGESETLLKVPRFDFNWQLGYDEAKPILLPKGTRIECTAHFDNSANNPANPNPNVEVRWGDQSWEEMMIGWFAVVIDPKVDPAALRKAKTSD